jgi:disulfide bond formation protein DsbB
MVDRPEPTDRALLAAGALLASVATAGSLWFSLGLGLIPCDLCWYQRVLMYPLVVVFGAATVEGRAGAWLTALPLSVGGAALAAYHSYLQVVTVSCGFGGGCAVVQWQAPLVGLSIPNLSLVAFLLLTGLGVVLARRPR